MIAGANGNKNTNTGIPREVGLIHPTNNYHVHWTAQVVTEALKELSQQQREVIVMHLWGELSFDVIAETIGGSRSSAHRAFRQGILEMQKRFRQPQQLVSSSQNETNE